MTQLSQNFTRSEFACKCGCGFDTVDAELLQYLQDMRDHFDAPIHINSGCRCPAYNRSSRVRGASNSQHLYGRAADFTVRGVSPARVQLYLISNYPRISVGRYRTFTHMDSRSGQRQIWESS